MSLEDTCKQLEHALEALPRHPEGWCLRCIGVLVELGVLQVKLIPQRDWHPPNTRRFFELKKQADHCLRGFNVERKLGEDPEAGMIPCSELKEGDVIKFASDDAHYIVKQVIPTTPDRIRLLVTYMTFIDPYEPDVGFKEVEARLGVSTITKVTRIEPPTKVFSGD